MLKEYPNQNISFIAKECGFDSPAYYAKNLRNFIFVLLGNIENLKPQ